jgi:hypothetical protein
MLTVANKPTILLFLKSAKTHNTTTLSITTIGVSIKDATLSITTLDIMGPDILIKSVTLSITTLDTVYADCRK